MTAHDGQRCTATGLVVAAAITHVSGRVLAIQRFDDDAWLVPGGPVAVGERIGVRLRAHVRNATGFEIKQPIDIGTYADGDAQVRFFRCRISGVGADITSHTRTMRWMDRAAIAAHMAEPFARGMRDALDADAGVALLDVVAPVPPTLLAS